MQFATMQPKSLHFATFPRISAMLTAENVQDWLDKHDHPRAWLASRCNVSLSTVKGWLSANRPITGSAEKIISDMMRGQISLKPELSIDDYQRMDALAKSQAISLQEWITNTLREGLAASRVLKNTHESQIALVAEDYSPAANIVPLPPRKDVTYQFVKKNRRPSKNGTED